MKKKEKDFFNNYFIWKIARCKMGTASGPRIQGRVSEEQYEFYKELKKQYIMQTGEPVGDGQFLMIVLKEYAKNKKPA